MDRADICLYSITNPIQNGTVPNIVIELKKDKSGANKNAYEQVTRYLRWLEAILSEDEFEYIKVFIIAPQIGKIKRDTVNTIYEDKIQMYSIRDARFVQLYK